MDDLALKLYNRTLELKGVELNDIQSAKFKHACKKAIIENPNVDFTDLLTVAKVYLHYILDNPGLRL